MKRVEVFGSVLCPYCHQARRFLKGRGIAFDYFEIPMIAGFKFPTRRYREMKRRSGGQATVPQIFVDGAYYGDEDTLIEDERSGRIDTVFR